MSGGYQQVLVPCSPLHPDGHDAPRTLQQTLMPLHAPKSPRKYPGDQQLQRVAFLVACQAPVGMQRPCCSGDPKFKLYGMVLLFYYCCCQVGSLYRVVGHANCLYLDHNASYKSRRELAFRKYHSLKEVYGAQKFRAWRCQPTVGPGSGGRLDLEHTAASAVPA